MALALGSNHSSPALPFLSQTAATEAFQRIPAQRATSSISARRYPPKKLSNSLYLNSGNGTPSYLNRPVHKCRS